MTTGYLWTGQFEECKSAVTGNGKGQSMELDSETLDGHWSTDTKTGMDFFIINDAIFSKLCILGDDVEPCFEGAKVTAPDVSTSFSKVDDGFKKTLYSMMQELKFALEGGKNMNNDNPEVVEVLENNEVVEVVENNEEVAAAEVETPVVEEENNEVVENIENNEENQNSEVELPEDSFAKKDEDEEDKEEDNDSNEDNAQNDEDEDEEEKKKKEYSVEELEVELSELQEKYSALEKDYQALVEFKKEIDNEKKDALIKSFYMLSDEDKKDVVENKEKYSLDDIEAKLSIICVKKKVNFDLEDTSKNDKEIEEENEAAVTYALEQQESSVPAWISALRKTQNDRNN
jgi:hypothetical protein